jgi:flagellar L-ring protein precursor FlgH
MSRSHLAAMVFACAACGWLAVEAHAQSSSLYGPAMDRPPLTLGDNSWTMLADEPIKEIQLNDLITVVVLESEQMLSQGETQRRAQSRLDMQLQNWPKLKGFGLIANNDSDSLPRARGNIQGQLQNTAEVETQSKVSFRITCRVVDIRPNGNLVIEAHKKVQNNNEIWEQSLTGIIRREDVKPDNTVLSERIYELSINKREAGHVRDAYRRGWLLRAMDRYKLF